MTRSPSHWVPVAAWFVASALFAAAGCGGDTPAASPREIITTRTLGLAYLDENRLDEAAQEFEKLARMAPEEASGHANLGLVRMRQGRFDAAERAVRRALELAPGDPDVRLLMAALLTETGRAAEARGQLDAIINGTPDHLKARYALAQLDSALPAARRPHLEAILDRAPGNLVARLDLVETLLRQDELDGAVAQLETVRQQAAEFTTDAAQAFDRAMRAAVRGERDPARAAVEEFRSLIQLTGPYQRALQDLAGPGGSLAGYPMLTFSRDLRTGRQAAVLEALSFTDVTTLLGLGAIGDAGAGASMVAAADADGDGAEDLYVVHRGAQGVRAFFFRNQLGGFADVTDHVGLPRTPDGSAAVFADVDNDGRLDLYTGGAALWLQQGDGAFRRMDVQREGVAEAAAPVLMDLDQDGDLDLFVTTAAGNRAFRNNLDGTFTERTAAMGLAARAGAARAAAFGDFDDDGVVDLVVAYADGVRLYRNQRQGHFADVAATVGLGGLTDVGALAVGDVDNDGYLDVFAGSRSGERHQLFLNRRDGTFAPAATLAMPLRAHDATFLDVDNDGRLDLLVAGEPTRPDRGGLALWRNADGTGGFQDESARLPGGLPAVTHLAALDFEGDGDLDVLVAQRDGAVRLLRNDGGNANQYVRVRLVGLGTGSGKNNRFGLGAKLEVRAGDLYQMRVVDQPVIHLGLGNRLKADVVRITWPNGVPQNFYYPGSDQDLVEEQTLKGSCAFVYTWNGSGFEFITDIMWRSAIGMPLGIMGGDRTALAPPDASREYVRLPGPRLRPRNGEYVLQVTEELWETAYVDEIVLLALDHPDSVDVFVDERFVPPGPAALAIYPVSNKRLPRGATDMWGRDVRAELAAKDDVYVGPLVPTRYQGLTEPHDLILDFGELDPAQPLRLFLQGWVFPTDASINVALSQSGRPGAEPPSLAVIGPDGRWRTVVADVGFPAGKDKTVIVDLTGKLLTRDGRLRLRTNMQLYWDHAFLAVGEAPAPVRTTRLTVRRADLRYRGFSRPFRKGGRYGPHWFEYTSVSTESPWQAIQGPFTRFGDVTELLHHADDRYVVMGPGDEMTVRFRAADAPPVPEGWSRDFLLYSVGWIKDADLNTAAGHRVEPLPFHAMSEYPYRPPEAFPSTPAHRRFLEQYLTRTAEGGRR